MGAPTNYYVDPAIAGDSGTGTIGDPYGDLQYALNTVTRDSTNGDQFNIKAGTDEILTGIISLATYGTPTADAPIILRGYTSAANDGGIGVINGNAGNFNLLPSGNFWYLIDMKLHNSGTASLLSWSGVNYAIFENCEFATTSNSAGLTVTGGGCRFLGCNFSGGWTGSSGLTLVTTAWVIGCTFEGTPATAMISVGVADAAVVIGNIFTTSGGTSCVRLNNVRGGIVMGNTIYSAAGTGKGIFLDSGGADGVALIDNYIEGFSGAGGLGLSVASGAHVSVMRNNKFYNNTTHETGGTIAANAKVDLGGNGTVASSGLTNAGGGDFSPTSVLRALGWPSSFLGVSTSSYKDIGAAQHADPAGGGGLLTHGGMSGGLNG